jgi:hypothetical protein
MQSQDRCRPHGRSLGTSSSRAPACAMGAILTWRWTTWTWRSSPGRRLASAAAQVRLLPEAHAGCLYLLLLSVLQCAVHAWLLFAAARGDEPSRG